MQPTSLIAPTARLYDSWQACVREFGDEALHGASAYEVEGFGPNRSSFEQLLARLEQLADTSRAAPPGRVHCSHWWIVDQDAQDPVVGFVALRHNLDNEYLARAGGHIGYSVRPGRRRRGHAGAALDLVLQQAAGRGMDRVLVTCEEPNLASRAVIEAAGGVYESSIEEHRRYWIATPRR